MTPLEIDEVFPLWDRTPSAYTLYYSENYGWFNYTLTFLHFRELL